MQEKKYSIDIDGNTLDVIFSDLAINANGSVMVSVGKTKILVTACMSKSDSHLPYFPLTVDFEERFYSIGRILGSRFMRREGRPSTNATLTSRMTDRTIRPLFPDGFHKEVQIVTTCLSLGDYDTDFLSIFGASLALSVSNIPFSGPVSPASLTLDGDSFTYQTIKEDVSKFMFCGNKSGITMIEQEGFIDQKQFVSAIKKAEETIKKLHDFQTMIIAEQGKKKIEVKTKETPKEIIDLFEQQIEEKLQNVIGTEKSIYDIKDEWKEIISEKLEGDLFDQAVNHFEKKVEVLVHQKAVKEGIRVDGRDLDQIRQLNAKAGGLVDTVHGTGIFYRGDTHVLSALTLGGPGDALMLNTPEKPEKEEFFMHHYNFPPFASGETGRIGSPNRRMIGHGALAEKAIAKILPVQSSFPYTIRIVSECLSSNGSTSMASVCASSLALMDGGVPIKEHVAGISMGVMTYDGKYVVLTDIQGPEDHYGGMDLKVAGTKDKITAIQMDTKLQSVPSDVIIEAVEKANAAKNTVIKTLDSEISAHRTNISKDAPSIIKVKISPDMIGKVIGSGGESIKKIQEISGVSDIKIEDDGSVFITGKQDQTEVAKKMIDEIAHEFSVGENYEGEVSSIKDFGAFVRFFGEREGLVHISEMSKEHVTNVSDLVKVGDCVPVVIKEIKKDGKISLSIKDRNPEFFL